MLGNRCHTACSMLQQKLSRCLLACELPLCHASRCCHNVVGHVWPEVNIGGCPSSVAYIAQQSQDSSALKLIAKLVACIPSRHRGPNVTGSVVLLEKHLHSYAFSL